MAYRRVAYRRWVLAALASIFVIASVNLCIAEDRVGDPNETRRRPGHSPRPTVFPPFIYESVPDIEQSSASEFIPVRDRWRKYYIGKWYDPYNQNILKGDLPVFGSPGNEWFFELGLVSETVFERTKIAVPVGISSTAKPGRTDTLGNGSISATSQNLITSFVSQPHQQERLI